IHFPPLYRGSESLSGALHAPPTWAAAVPDGLAARRGADGVGAAVGAAVCAAANAAASNIMVPVIQWRRIMFISSSRGVKHIGEPAQTLHIEFARFEMKRILRSHRVAVLICLV